MRTLFIRAVMGVLLFPAVQASATSAQYDLDAWQQRVAAETSIDRLGRHYLELLLEEDPANGIEFGIHGTAAEPDYYDRRLADATPERAAEIAAARRAFLERLDKFDSSTLGRTDQVDLHILKTRVALHHFTRTKLGVLTTPLNWVSSLGNAMSGLVFRDYAPLEMRLKSFGSRCAVTGEFLAGVRASLVPPNVRPTAIEKQVAVQRLKSMTSEDSLHRATLPGLLRKAALDPAEQDQILQACDAAVAQIDKFAAWFEQQISPRQDGEWRIGKTLYDEYYDLQLDYPLSPDELLAEAEKWLAAKSAELVTVGRAIHDDYLSAELAAGTVRPAADIGDGQVVRDIFAKMSEDRSTLDTLIDDSYAMADQIIGFVREQDLMDLPPSSKLRIEPTPPHLAGFAVAQILTAPPFEPDLESVWLWDIDLLRGAPDFLKEYNRPTLAMVYIHEGVPGHFVQLEYSNRFERIMPKVFWNGAMVEGWASYIASQMVDAGFTVYPDHPFGHELQQMVDDKLVLRSVINAIIDIRLQTSDWSEAEAIELMTGKGFQEEAEARGKLARAQQGAVQLTSYFAGYIAILDILEQYRAKKGRAFNWKEFNERLVGAGSPPFFALREYMLEEN